MIPMTHKRLCDALDRIFQLELKLWEKDVEIAMLKFEIELDRGIKQSIAHIHQKLLLETANG